MTDPTAIHNFARKNKLSGKIRFIDYTDGKEHYYYSVINDMGGKRMSAFDHDAPYVGQSVAYVRKMFKAIREKATKIIEVIGDF